MTGVESQPRLEDVLAEIVKRISPAVADLMAKKDSGEIRLRFGVGDFKQAVRTEVVLS